MTSGEREALLESARNVLLGALPDAWAIYVYGSFAQGQEWSGSDLDLGVLLPPGRKLHDKLALMSQLSDSVHRDVDLVDVREIGNVLRREILEKGRTAFVSDPEKVLSWEASAMSDYARHRESIKGILEDFQRTGVGYAK